MPEPRLPKPLRTRFAVERGRERTHEQDNREDLRRADEFRSPPSTTSTGLLPAGYEPDLGDAS